MFWRPVAVDELPHCRQEVVRHGAADTAIGKLDNVVLTTGVAAAGLENLAIDPDIAKFIDDEGDTPPSRIFQKMPDDRRLPRTEEAGDHRRRDLRHAHPHRSCAKRSSVRPRSPPI